MIGSQESYFTTSARCWSLPIGWWSSVLSLSSGNIKRIASSFQYHLEKARFYQRMP